MFSLSSPQEERDGERRSLLLNAPLPVPLPVPLPTRASRGEGENFWWLRPAPKQSRTTPCLLTSQLYGCNHTAEIRYGLSFCAVQPGWRVRDHRAAAPRGTVPGRADRRPVFGGKFHMKPDSL